jgi:hypothetical protein
MVPGVLSRRPGAGAVGLWTRRRGHRTQLGGVGAQAYERRSRREGDWVCTV